MTAEWAAKELPVDVDPCFKMFTITWKRMHFESFCTNFFLHFFFNVFKVPKHGAWMSLGKVVKWTSDNYDTLESYSKSECDAEKNMRHDVPQRACKQT